MIPTGRPTVPSTARRVLVPVGRVLATVLLVPAMVSYVLLATTVIVSELVAPTNWWPWPFQTDGPFRGTRLLEHVRSLSRSSPGRYVLFVVFVAAGAGSAERLRNVWGNRWRGLFGEPPETRTGITGDGGR